MKNLINNILRNWILVIVVMITGLFLGWILFHSSGQTPVPPAEIEGHEGHDHESDDPQLWTCSMHPQIKQNEPGQCPICAMDLIPLTTMTSVGDDIDPNEIMMTESAAKLASIQTSVVVRGTPQKELYLQGKVHIDERNIAEITARFGGRIEELFVNFTGQKVFKGQKLATIYSPDLITAQRELIEAISLKESRPSLYNAALGKLRLWGLSDDQITEIEENGEPILYFDLLSPASGTVTMRHIATGDYVKEGDQLFKVVDLSRLWVLFDAYESDLPWISTGDNVEFTIQSLPGRKFSSKVTFIDPFIDAVKRVAEVRVEITNTGHVLKPEMFASGIIRSEIGSQAAQIIIPKSAVLWTGKRSVVYLKVPGRDQPSFLYREIELGPDAGDMYVVANGLEEGEEVVTNGLFKVDAAAQLIGLPSMMNPDGGVVMTGHNHGDMTAGSTSGMSGNTVESFNISGEFKSQLTSYYNTYLKMKDAFVKSDASLVSIEAKKVIKSLKSIDMALLDGESHMIWMDHSGNMDTYLSDISEIVDIEKQRQIFSDLNSVLYESIKTFGLDNTTTYYQFCPMANGDAGAYWFSEAEEIRNPYFGDEMLTCGEVEEIIQTNK